MRNPQLLFGLPVLGDGNLRLQPRFEHSVEASHPHVNEPTKL